MIPDFGISAAKYGAKVSCLIVFAGQIPLLTCGFIENTKHTFFSTIAPNRQLSKNRFVKLEDFVKQQVSTLFHIKSTTSYGAKKPKMGTEYYDKLLAVEGAYLENLIYAVEWRKRVTRKI